jgi:hypothetical protein
MKRLISIPLIILVLFSGISVKFATHYCEGNIAAAKISLTGELATCGMERNSYNTSLQDIYRNNCCEDFISAYSICNNYLSSAYNFNNHDQQVVNLIIVPAGFLSNQETIINHTNEDIRPPGIYQPNSVDRPVICIFRI